MSVLGPARLAPHPSSARNAYNIARREGLYSLARLVGTNYDGVHFPVNLCAQKVDMYMCVPTFTSPLMQVSCCCMFTLGSIQPHQCNAGLLVVYMY